MVLLTLKVIREVSYAGRPCGELFEIKMCNNPCEVYHWVSGGWAECQLIGADQQRGCGTGDQFRQVRLVFAFYILHYIPSTPVIFRYIC